MGRSVAGAGDVNGDGYDDVIVGAPTYSPGGIAYLFYGSPTGIDFTTPGASFVGNSVLGDSVAIAGDVNGDGYDDLLIGDPQYNDGEVYLIYGNGSSNQLAGQYQLGAKANATFRGVVASGQRLGQAVAGAGDVNGDGYADLLMGALDDSSSRGVAYLVYGNGSSKPLLGLYPFPSRANITWTGEASNNYFGNEVSSAGDVDGDGYDDVIIGAPGYNGLMGRAYLYKGSATGIGASAFATFTGQGGTNYAGYGATGVGDVNGDGYDDLLFGAYGYISYTGRAYLIYGNGTGSPLQGAYNLGTQANATFTGDSTNSYFGYSVARAGDTNRDGLADFLIGATGDARVYLFYGNQSGGLLRGYYQLGTATANSTFTGITGYNVAVRIASAGDVNGDGWLDILVGANNGDKAYLVLGSNTHSLTVPAGPVIYQRGGAPTDLTLEVHALTVEPVYVNLSAFVGTELIYSFQGIVYGQLTCQIPLPYWQPGSYEVTVVVTSHLGQEVQDSVTVTINPAWWEYIVPYLLPGVICFGAGAGIATIIFWRRQRTPQTPVPKASGKRGRSAAKK